MKKQLIILAIIIAVLGLGVAVYFDQKQTTEKNNDTPSVSFKEYSFDKIGIKFSAPADMSVAGDDSQDNIFTVIVQRGNYPEQNYYQLYGILQPTSNPIFDTEIVKGELFDGSKNTTIDGLSAVQGQYKGERNNLVTFIFTSKGIFKLATSPSTSESEAITNSILNTLKFTFSNDQTGAQSSVQKILANKYSRLP